MKVIEGDKAKEAKTGKGQQKDKVPQIDICRAVANYINHEWTLVNAPQFPHTFRTITYDGVARRIISIDSNGVCRPSNEERVFGEFNKFLIENSKQLLGLYGLPTRMIMEAIKWWVNVSPCIDFPPLLEVGPGSSPCWHRWPCATEDYLVEDGHEKLQDFDDFINRCGDSGKSFRIWIGSLFDPTSYRQQYVWMRGQGMNGKSSVIRLLKHVMGSSFCAQDASMADDKFWTHSLLHKRLVCFSDCNCYAFPNSQRFKSVSGDDPVRVEQKNKDPFTAELECKFLFASNEKPSITSQISDTRRIIYLEVEPITCEPDPQYDDRLLENAPWIIANCISHYTRHIAEKGKKGHILADNTALADLLALNEGELEAELGMALDFEPVTKDPKRASERWLTTNEEMRKILGSKNNGRAGSTANDRKAIRWLETKGVIYTKVKMPDGSTKRFWVGCKTTKWGQKMVNAYTGSEDKLDELEKTPW